MEEFNFEEIKNKALEQLKSDKSLLGKNGAFAPLLESILNAALEGEMDAHLDEQERNLGNRVSAETISYITDRVLPELKAWRGRPLEPIYAIVWMDTIHYKVFDESGRAVSRAIYNVLGIDKEGNKDVLGMYISKSEGANFWLSVLTDLQNKGIKDILIASIDNLAGFADAIESIFPQTTVQLCIVHQIRNSCKYCR